MITTEIKIQRILDHGFDVPSIFKSVLKKESGFIQDEEILDVILLEREYISNHDTKSGVYSKAQLLIATTHGLIIIEEGLDEIDINYLGYKIRHIFYNKIASIELDICCLLGILRISINTCSDDGIAIEFNTADYREKFETFISVIRKQIVESTNRK